MGVRAEVARSRARDVVHVGQTEGTVLSSHTHDNRIIRAETYADPCHVGVPPSEVYIELRWRAFRDAHQR